MTSIQFFTFNSHIILKVVSIFSLEEYIVIVEGISKYVIFQFLIIIESGW